MNQILPTRHYGEPTSDRQAKQTPNKHKTNKTDRPTDRPKGGRHLAESYITNWRVPIGGPAGKLYPLARAPLHHFCGDLLSEDFSLEPRAAGAHTHQAVGAAYGYGAKPSMKESVSFFPYQF